MIIAEIKIINWVILKGINYKGDIYTKYKH